MARYSPNWAEQMMEPMETGEYVPVEDFERLSAADHFANEWADMATNGIQWLRNIRDGISTTTEALAEMESNLERVRAKASSSATADHITNEWARSLLENDRLRVAHTRLRGLVAEREKGEQQIPYWLVLEWIDDLFRRPAPSAGEQQ